MLRSTFGPAFVLAFVLAFGLAAGPAAAEPVNLDNPTARKILVQVDENIDDFGAIGAAFGTAVEADFASDGVTATVTVSGSVVEDLVTTVFDGAATVVPGSFTDYEVAIDVATGAVLSASIEGEITVPILGTIAVVQTASSSTLAGFKLQDIFGFEIPIFCTSGVDCTIVPGAPYDPATGQLNAVGNIATAFNVFTPFGDLKLSEGVDCEVTMSQAVYTDGQDVVITSLRFTNALTSALPTRLRLQITLPFGITVNAIDLGAGGGFAIPASFDKQLGPVTMFTLQPGQPRGPFSWRCALEDPINGAVQAEDVAPFEFQ
jgi:hypothetical protein